MQVIHQASPETAQAGPSTRLPTEYPGIALIVGAGSAVGRGIALSLLRSGCTKFILTDSSSTLLEFTSLALKNLVHKTQIYTTIFFLSGSLSTPGFINSIFEEVRNRFGRIDYAINCHNISGVPDKMEDALWGSVRAVMGDTSGNISIHTSPGTDVEMDEGIAGIGGGAKEGEKKSDWNLAAQGLKGLFELTRDQLAVMQKQQIRHRDGYEHRKQRGAIVNVIISGAEGLAEVEGPVADTISSLIKQDAKDNAVNLVRANGIITGPMIGPSLSSTSHAKGTRLGGRMTTVEEVVDLAVFLCNEKSSFINGQVFGEEIKAK